MRNVDETKKQLEMLVIKFISDYEAWNHFAAKHIGANDKDIDDAIYTKYKAIINTYCLPNKTFQGLAYSSESNHQAAKETIESIELDETDNSKAVVETKMPDSQGNPDFYSYQCILKDEKWYLDEIYYCGLPCL